jgi:hypothetical protein
MATKGSNINVSPNWQTTCVLCRAFAFKPSLKADYAGIL